MSSRLILACALLLANAARADDSFTRNLSPADFEAAGLGKLTPEELARLDALIQGRQSGAIARAKEETTKVVADTVRKQVQAEDRKEAEKKTSSMGIIERMKVVLKPGTEIEYTTLDASLVPPFHGWQKGTVFTLTNGQQWAASDDEHYWAPRTDQPLHVRIVPGSMGSFFMEIEHGGRPRVKFLGNTGTPPAPAAAPAH